MFSNKLFCSDPNRFEFFLSIVELNGIFFSNLSLITVANLNSKNLSLSSPASLFL